jgi:hypothetical protein
MPPPVCRSHGPDDIITNETGKNENRQDGNEIHDPSGRQAAGGNSSSKWLGLAAVALASVNIFGGFAVTQRMLSMYKKRERKDG